MNVIIAGGSGLIGDALAQKLLEEGSKVWVLSRNPDQSRLAKGVFGVRWDARSPEGWVDLVEQADAIVNLAGENLASGRWTNERKRRFLNSRVEAGRAIVAAVEQAHKRPSVVVQACAVGYYGPSDDRILEEDAPAGSDSMAQICVQWEQSSQAVRDLGVRHVITRQGIVLARGGDILNNFELQFNLFGGGPLGSGRQWISWIHIQDMVNVIRFLLHYETTSGVYNALSPEPVTNANFGKTLGKVMRRPYWFPVPAFALRLVLGEMSSMVLEGQRAMPRRLLDAGFQFEFPGLDAALMDLYRGQR